MKQAFLAASLMSTLYAADEPQAPPQPAVKVGDMAPDFTLNDQNGNKVSPHEVPTQTVDACQARKLNR
jgi:hypothetical protein